MSLSVKMIVLSVALTAAVASGQLLGIGHRMSINKTPVRRRRRKFQFSLRSLFLGVFAVALVCFVLRDVPMAQPIDGILGLVLGHETIYGPSYSEFGWIRVRPGMSGAEVKAYREEPGKR